MTSHVLRRFLVCGAALAALCVAACATSPASIHTDAGKGLVVAEAGLDVAVTAADAAVQAKLTTAAQNASIHALTAPCPTGVAITAAVVPQCPVVATKARAEAAYAASDASSYPQLITQLGLYAAQLAANHP